MLYIIYVSFFAATETGARDWIRRHRSFLPVDYTEVKRHARNDHNNLPLLPEADEEVTNLRRIKIERDELRRALNVHINGIGTIDLCKVDEIQEILSPADANEFMEDLEMFSLPESHIPMSRVLNNPRVAIERGVEVVKADISTEISHQMHADSSGRNTSVNGSTGSVTGYDSRLVGSKKLRGVVRAPSWQMSASQNDRSNPFDDHNYRAALYSDMDRYTFRDSGPFGSNWQYSIVSNDSLMTPPNPFSDYSRGQNRFQLKAGASTITSSPLGGRCDLRGQFDQISGSMRFETDVCI